MVSFVPIRVVHDTQCPDIGNICRVRDEPPQIHDLQSNISEVRVSAGYAVTNWLGIETQIPFRISHTSIVYRRLDGTAFVPDYIDIHHRNETLLGLGDVWLRAKLSRQLNAFRFSFFAGFSAPTGQTQENPFALGDAGLEHQHTQFGTGTWVPIFAFDATYQSTLLLLSVYGQAQFPLGQNSKFYLAGTRFSSGLAVLFELFQAFRIGPTFDISAETAERWAGQVLQDGNVGRTDLLLGISASLMLNKWNIGLIARTPVAQIFENQQGQLSYPLALSLSLNRVW